MTPGTTIEVPSDVPGPLVSTPDSRTPPAVNARGEGPGWETLNTPQKLALYPLADRWALLSGLQKRRWLALAQGFAALPSDEQARLHDRMTEWASLSAQQRNQARLNFAVTHRMAPEDKRTQWNAYQALSEEDKRKLAARAAQKPQGAAPALRPVSPKKLAKVPAAINAPGNPANPPKVAPVPGATARIAAPGGLPPENRSAATAENPGVAPAALLPPVSAPAPSVSASTPASSDAPAEAQPGNLYLN